MTADDEITMLQDACREITDMANKYNDFEALARFDAIPALNVVEAARAATSAIAQLIEALNGLDNDN